MAKVNKISLRAKDCWNTIGVWGRAEEKCKDLREYIHCRNCPVFSEIGHTVFEKSAPSGYLSEWKKAVAHTEDSGVAETNSVLIFRVACEWFAWPATILSEVATERSIHRIPRNLNRFVAGIVNINGEIKVCYSLTELLELNLAEENEVKTRRLVVIELSDIHYVFLVDEVKGLHCYSDVDLRPVPATLTVDNSELLRGTIEKFDHQIAIFDVDKLREKLEGAVL